MRLFRLRRAPTDPQERADRFLLAKRLRVVAGIHLDPQFESLTVAVIQGVGQGKYLRVRQLYADSMSLGHELRNGLRQLATADNPTARDVWERSQDLALLQVRLIHQARAGSGKLGEQLVAVALRDPGLWRIEFDGRPLYSPLSHPETIAEQTGVCVIDALPAKDLAAGGHGWPLTPLPIWIALADRSSPVASQIRVLLSVGEKVSAIVIPPSDGLDDIYPAVQYRSWARPASSSPLNESDGESEFAATVARDLATWLPKASESETLTLILAVRPGPNVDVWRSALEQATARWQIRELAEFGFDPRTPKAAWTAILAAMFVDQMPANLPWLTGAETPRILGRLTPGTPAAWRQLLREMADHHPPAMRLRDAV
jgi:1,6-anhydro-N-acetylmuramate kinase